MRPLPAEATVMDPFGSGTFCELQGILSSPVIRRCEVENLMGLRLFANLSSTTLICRLAVSKPFSEVSSAAAPAPEHLGPSVSGTHTHTCCGPTSEEGTEEVRGRWSCREY